jgi:biotin carboxyl carrier protein
VTTLLDPRPSISAKRKTAGENRIVLALAVVLAGVAVALVMLIASGRAHGPISASQITQLLRNGADPDATLYALDQLQVRIQQRKAIARWYPELLRLSNSDNEQVAHRVADIMGQVPGNHDFHEALLNMLRSRSMLVKNSAALALAEFNDPAGHEQLLSMMDSVRLTAPSPGRVESVISFGTEIHHGDVVAQLRNDGALIKIYSPIGGRLRSLAVQENDVVSAGSHVATLEPGPEQMMDLLGALRRIGRVEDLALIRPYESAENPALRQQAQAAAEAIREREAVARK